MRVTIPEFCLVVLVGASGSGKSSFARKHFAPTETISSDDCRALVRDDATALDAMDDAFDVLHFIARKRLAARRLTVVDATNVRPEDRKRFVGLAREYHALAVAVVFDLPEKLCRERNAARPDREFGPHVVRNQIRTLRRHARRLGREGFRYQYRFSSEEEVAAVEIERQRLWTDRRDEHGPFDKAGCTWTRATNGTWRRSPSCVPATTGSSWPRRTGPWSSMTRRAAARPPRGGRRSRSPGARAWW